jgi:hypothetical protein
MRVSLALVSANLFQEVTFCSELIAPERGRSEELALTLHPACHRRDSSLAFENDEAAFGHDGVTCVTVMALAPIRFAVEIINRLWP